MSLIMNFFKDSIAISIGSTKGNKPDRLNNTTNYW